MKETARARQAWADYLAMGPGRSLEKLLARYRSGTESVPTRRMTALKTWSRTFGWQARLEAIAQRDAAEIEARETAAKLALQAEGIRNRLNRLTVLDDLASRLVRVVVERADADEFKKIAGGTTGLLVRQYKIGRDGTVLEEFEIDTGLLAEIRAYQKQAAQELGQWVEKGELTGKDGAPLFKVYEGFDPDQV